MGVYTYCDGVYLEQQDMWRLAGIFRDVKLISRPKSYIHDYYITTDLDADYKHAMLNLEIEIRNHKILKGGGYRLIYIMKEDNGWNLLVKSLSLRSKKIK